MDYKRIYEKHRGTLKILCLMIVITFLGFVYMTGRDALDDGVVDTFEKEEESGDKEQEESLSDLIYVYVCGMVNNPGVVRCNDNTRIFEILDLAGGVREDADITGIDMAKKAVDGQRIYIPATGEISVDLSGNIKRLVNINTASVDELMGLPGIGSSRATDIVNYRTRNGLFGCIEDIMKVSGIKEAAYEKIRDMICV